MLEPEAGSEFGVGGSNVATEQYIGDLSSEAAPIAIVSEGAPQSTEAWLQVAAAALLGISTLLVLRTGALWFRMLLWIRRRTNPDFDLQHEVTAFAAQHGITRSVTAVTADIGEPCACGIRNWVIVFPRDCPSRLSKTERSALIAHELAHLVRRDPAWLWFNQLLCSALWFQPLNRMATSRVRDFSEVCSDDWAVDHGVGPLQLARCLTSVASWMEGKSAMPVATAATGSRQGRPGLTDRIERLVQANSPRTPARWRLMSASLMVLATIACFLLLPRLVWAEHEANATVHNGATARQSPANHSDAQPADSLDADLQALVADLNRVERLLGESPDIELQDVARSLKKRFADLRSTVADKKTELTNEGDER